MKKITIFAKDLSEEERKDVVNTIKSTLNISLAHAKITLHTAEKEGIILDDKKTDILKGELLKNTTVIIGIEQVEDEDEKKELLDTRRKSAKQQNSSLVQSNMYQTKPGEYLVVNASGTYYIKVAIVPKDEVAYLLPAFRDAGFNPTVIENNETCSVSSLLRITKKISDNRIVELAVLKNVGEHVHKLFIATFLTSAARQELHNMTDIKANLIDYFNGEKYLNVPEPTTQVPKA